MAARRYAARVRRLKLSAVAWGVWMILSTTLWVADEWDVNGAFERFGHEGDPGQWNPTLWALGIGVPTLIVGIMALGVYFVRRLHMLLPTQQRPVRVLGDHEQARRDPQRARSGVESPFRLVQERGDPPITLTARPGPPRRTVGTSISMNSSRR